MFWIGKAKKILTEIKNTTKKVRLSPVEILILTQLRARQLRNKHSAEHENGKEFGEVGQYGYEMIQQLNELFAGSWEAKSGTIYPMLSRLERDKNLIQGKRKKSPLGPVKKVYSLTEMGKRAIDRLISDTFESNIDFILNYVDLVFPFIENIREIEPANADELFEKIMMVPTKFFNLAMEDTITEFDKEQKEKKLKRLKTNLQTVIKNIDQELS